MANAEVYLSRVETADGVRRVSPIVTRIFPVDSQFLGNFQDTRPVMRTAEDPVTPTCLVLIGTLESRQNLLFQAATSYLTEGMSVCYIRPLPLDVLPSCVHGMNRPNAVSAHLLKMLYLPTLEAVVDYLSNLHQVAAPTDVLIVDELAFYASQSMEEDVGHTLAKISALMLDSAHFLKTKSDHGKVRLLVGTDTIPTNYSRVLFQFFADIYSIQEIQKTRFKMAPLVISESQTVMNKKAHSSPSFTFYTKDSQIFLEEIS